MYSILKNKKNQYLVSVIMPSFNSSVYIGEAIESVLKQTYDNWELIIIDGGSTDNSVYLINNYIRCYNNIVLIQSVDDDGPGHARAIGVKRSNGHFIAFLDSDDLWLPTKLTKQISFMLEHNLDFTYTRYRILYQDRSESIIVPMSFSYNYFEYLHRRGISNSTVVLSRVVLSENILNNCRRSAGEDTLWWLLILREGIIAKLLNTDLSRYRDTPGSLSKKKKIHNLTTVWSIYRTELNLHFICALLFFSGYIINVLARIIIIRFKL